jgi:signal transduction histidine kinase
VIDGSEVSEGESRRLVAARERATQRVRRQRDTLRPLGWAAILVVAAGAAGTNPQPGLHGKGLGVTLALCAFAGALVLAISARFPERAVSVQAAVIAAMGAAGVALVALQPQGATGLAGGAAVWMALVALPLPLGLPLGIGMAVVLDATSAVSGSPLEALLANTLQLALLGLIGYFMKQARESQQRTELLLAQLEDAREGQLRTAALEERSRIASELHDVLAHSLSGAALQLQAARKLAERERVTPPVRSAIDRAGNLVKDGLASARQAVGALRGDEMPGVTQLESLVTSFRDDLNIDATLSVEGQPRTLPADASLALYRGAQEALTNVARYAPGAITVVVLRYGPNDTALSVEDWVPAASGSPLPEGLPGVGGGQGLVGLRKRVDRVGGSVHAGATDNGWRVEVVVPT